MRTRRIRMERASTPEQQALRRFRVLSQMRAKALRARLREIANIEQALCGIGRGGCPEEGYDSTTGDLERVVNMIWDFIKAESSEDAQAPAAAPIQKGEEFLSTPPAHHQQHSAPTCYAKPA